MKSSVRQTLVDVILLIIACISGTNALLAQSPSPSGSITGVDRWAFKTNAFELLCTIPNVGVEFDLSPSEYNRLTLSLTAKYNPETWHTLSPVTVFNMLEIRPECRWWFRREQGTGKRFSSGAFYLGGFFHGGLFSVKLSPTGYQGTLLGAGASFGYDFPLYSFKKVALDFELGASLGVGIVNCQSYTMNSSETDYVYSAARLPGWRVLPYPLLSEIRACFVFRTLSIRDRYKKEDPKKVIRRQERQAAREAARQAKKEVSR